MTKDEFIQNILRDAKYLAAKAYDDYQHTKNFGVKKNPVWSHKELRIPGQPESQLETVMMIQVQVKNEIVETVTIRQGEYRDEPS